MRLFTRIESSFSSTFSCDCFSIQLSLVGSKPCSKVCAVSSSRTSLAETELNSWFSVGNTDWFDATVDWASIFSISTWDFSADNPHVWDLFPHLIRQLEVYIFSLCVPSFHLPQTLGIQVYSTSTKKISPCLSSKAICFGKGLSSSRSTNNFASPKQVGSSLGLCFIAHQVRTLRGWDPILSSNYPEHF